MATSKQNRQDSIFEPTEAIIIKSIVPKSIENSSSNNFDQFSYLVTVEYVSIQWEICKTYNDFVHLHDEWLKVVPCDSENADDKTKHCQCLPTFDNLDVEKTSETCDKLTNYLNKMLTFLSCRNHQATWEFLQVSQLSFEKELSKSLKEGYLSKQPRSEKLVHRLPLVRDVRSLQYSRKWFVIKDTFFTHLQTNIGPSRFPMLVDRAFEIIGHLDASHGHFDIDIVNLQRKIKVRCETLNEYDQWMQTFVELKKTAADFLDENKNRFDSFAPVREKQLGSWFINGKSYMESVAKALLIAKDEVFISSWWLSPELMLIRPANDDSMRLDNLLGRIADAGVRVFVMIFKEFSHLNDINSGHTEEVLTNKSKLGNIKVIRHPQKPLNNHMFWSHNEKMVIIDQKIAFIGGIDLCFGRWDDEHYRLVDLGNANTDDLVHSKRVSFSAEKQEVLIPSSNIDRKSLLFIGKDYLNPYEKKIENVERYDEDLIDRKTTARLPWHDEALVVFGQVARDAARHFIQRWNIHKYDKSTNDDSFPFLIPKTYQNKETFCVDNWQSFLNEKPFEIDAQCVRSLDFWSGGISRTETSIYNAYLNMIDAAKYFVFIETEFFVSIANDSTVENSIGEILYQRILRAERSKEKFRVFIVVPLISAENNSNAAQESLRYTMRTISKGENSLLKRLELAGVQPNDFVGVFGLRRNEVLIDKLITESIFVHSKLMIVDDRMAICGSANLNDRSLLGSRDSEFCLVVNDIEDELCQFDGKNVRIGRFCSTWRRRIFSQMLGVELENVVDPLSDEFFDFIRRVAAKNTSIYEEIFRCLPSNKIRSFHRLESFYREAQLRNTDPEKAKELLKEIQGFIVEFPIDFLDDEDLRISRLTREGILPNKFWT